MAKRGGARPNSGGARKGAGRKKSLAKELEAEFIKDKEGEAEFGFALYVSAMHDKKLQKRMRLFAAGVVMDRVWGKPKEKTEQSGELAIRVIRDEDGRNPSAASPSGASANKA